MTAVSGGSIVTSPVNGGTYAYRNNPSTSQQNFTAKFTETGGITTTYTRFYYQVATQDAGAAQRICAMQGTSAAPAWKIRGTTTGLKIQDAADADVGSAVVLNTNQWYRIEVKVFTNATTGTLDLLVDGVSKVSVTAQNTGTDCKQLLFGNTSNATHDYFIDDIAVNDGTGSFQNTYPGAGKIIHLHPDSTGDSAQWTPLASTNWSQTSEVTPDDATSYNKDKTLNNADMFNCGASGIGASDTVNVVSVGVRFANDVADATAAFKVQIEKTGSGTTTQSAAIVPNSTTWKTNATASPNAYPITLYQDPDSAAWTQTTLNSMQIGVKTTVAHTNFNMVSTLWALVDYTPAAASTAKQNKMMMMGVS